MTTCPQAVSAVPREAADLGGCPGGPATPGSDRWQKGKQMVHRAPLSPTALQGVAAPALSSENVSNFFALSAVLLGCSGGDPKGEVLFALRCTRESGSSTGLTGVTGRQPRAPKNPRGTIPWRRVRTSCTVAGLDKKNSWHPTAKGSQPSGVFSEWVHLPNPRKALHPGSGV